MFPLQELQIGLDALLPFILVNPALVIQVPRQSPYGPLKNVMTLSVPADTLKCKNLSFIS